MIHRLADCMNLNVPESTNIWQFCVIFPKCKIGEHCNICANVLVENDVVIGDYCTLFPYCNVAGYTILGEGVTIGALASTYPGIKIGDYATVGMNSAVIRNVKSASTVMGVPAKIIY